MTAPTQVSTVARGGGGLYNVLEPGPVLRQRVFGPLPPYSFVGDGS